MRGSPAGDLIQALGDAAGAQARELQSRQDLAQMERIASDFQTLKEWNAGNLAEKLALRAALAKVDPTHPLVTNAALQERIRQAGQRAITLTNDWDAVREAGTSFKY